MDKSESLPIEKVDSKVILPKFDELIQIFPETSGRQSMQMIGLCASESIFLQPESSSIFPPRGSLLHPGMMNFDVFQLFQSDDGMFVSPKISGLFRIEVRSFVHSRAEKSKVALWIMKLNGNETLGYTTIDFLNTTEISFVRYAEISPGDRIFAVARNVSDHNYPVRFAHGSIPADGIGFYGGFYITLIS